MSEGGGGGQGEGGGGPLRARRIEFVEALGALRVISPYDPEIVKRIKQLPRRQYEADTRTWLVPLDYAGEVLEDLAAFDFEVDEAVRRASARGGRNALIRRMRRAARRDGLTATQVNARVQEALTAAFPGDTWIVGQIANLRGQRGSNAWFDLVEQYEGEHQPRATLRAVAFPRTVARLEAVLAKMSPPLEIQNNLQIKVVGRITVYERRGTVQLEIQDIDPHYTIIQLNRRREAILQALDELGISEDNLVLPLSRVPLRVALITSAGSDACKDFLDELAASGFGFEVSLLDARVQGANLEPTVLRAMRWCARNADRLDVVAIVRGGGSRLDLEGFDSYALGEAVCRLPVPVVVGIGHQADVSVLDDLARSFKTPTAAAQALVALVRDFREELGALSARLVEQAAHQRARHAEALERLVQDLAREARHRLSTADERLHSLGSELGFRSRGRLEAAEADLTRLRQRADAGARGLLRGERRQVAHLYERLGPRRFLLALEREQLSLERLGDRLTRGSDRTLERARRDLAGAGLVPLERAAGDLIYEAEQALAMLSVRVEARDPARVLERGYAWVTDEAGRSVRDAGSVGPGERLRVRLSQGELDVVRAEDS